MKSKIAQNKMLFCLLFVLSATFGIAQSGNHVSSGVETSNFTVVDLATPSGQLWSTDRQAIPGYFSAIGTASYTGASDASNINGYVKHYANVANQAFSFPVGSGTDYRNISISGTRSATSVIATAWIVGNPSGNLDPTAPNAGSHSITSLGGGIQSVSSIGQWDWQDNGASGLTVTVSIPDLTSFAPASKLRLVGWNGSFWVNLSESTGASGNTENSLLSGTMKPGITALGIGQATDPLPPVLLSNVCPATTVNLTTALTITGLPTGAVITYHTGTPATAANMVATPTAVGANTYYVAFYDNITDCYGLTSTSVIVTINVCVDTDGDGIVDVSDMDDDGDGILDSVEDAASCTSASGVVAANVDCDGDGIPNSLDLDSDNDGINDIIEAGGTDVNGDGKADGTSNSSGIASSAGSGLTPPNTDGTGGSNPYDLDSDDDNITDLSESGLNPAFDVNGDGKIDGTTDTDGDGILVQVDGNPTLFGDDLRSDLSPTIEINGLSFTTAASEKDFVVNLFEINNKTNSSNSPIAFRIAKLSAFDITYSTTSGTSNVFGLVNNNNSNWTFTENVNFITATAKAGVTVPPNGSNVVGFKAIRKTGVPSNTSQNITVTIIYGSAGEEIVGNNIVETKITAN